MVSIVPEGESNYRIFDSNIPIGTITTSRNPYHAKNIYLDIELEKYDMAAANDLFRRLRTMLGTSLQVMLDPCDRKQARYLIAGGFERVRRCYEMQVSANNLKFSISDHIPLNKAVQGSAEYLRCCQLLYQSYAKTHERVSPLTASLQEFCRGLPETVVFRMENGQIIHWAFVEENEIAYVGTSDPQEFQPFAGALLSQMLAAFENIFFECDDCDSAAMALRSFFDLPDAPYCDTYVLS